MLTFQDLQQVPNTDRDRAKFVRRVIGEHKSSDLYQTAVIADEYDRCRNRTIMQYEKTLHTVTGQVIRDEWSPNHKCCSNYYNLFTDQQNQYLLSNGVKWTKAGTKKRLGRKFDNKLQEVGKSAINGGVCYGFFNYDHLEVFPIYDKTLPSFAPLHDEENNALMAGVSFWQIDESKPLRAVLYEEDGYTGYLWTKNKDITPNPKLWTSLGDGAYIGVKRPYKIFTRESQADGVEIIGGENYSSIPIYPMWSSRLKQSAIVGLREKIDTYDLIFNGFANDIDNARIFWIIKGAAGLSGKDDVDLLKFLERLRMVGGAALGEDQEVSPVPVEIPADARDKLLDRIERQLYRDAQAFNPDDVKSGATVTAQINAAYMPLDQKTNEYEFCVRDFLDGILAIAGIEDEPQFTRDKITNPSEFVQSVETAGTDLSKSYRTKKILDFYGDGDLYDEVIAQIDAEDMERLANIPAETGGNE